MKGAREYHNLFETGQYGKLFIRLDSHARGKTFRIFIIPEGEWVIGNIYNHSTAIEVYGVVRGHPGWTEEYGWLYKGKWVDDFNKLVEEKRKNKYWRETKIKDEAKFRKDEETKRVQKFLDQY